MQKKVITYGTKAWKTQKNKFKVIVLHCSLKGEQNSVSAEDQLEEVVRLTNALIDVEILQSTIIPLQEPRPSTYIGNGKLKQLKEIIYPQSDSANNEPEESPNIDLLVINNNLSPVQQRNLEKYLGCKVIDRTGLILEIFNMRAVSSEGKLQVKLATLSYQRSRLVKAWSHLERQRGGTSSTGGPGETQIEIDRRLIDEQIISIKKRLQRVHKMRSLHRKKRKKLPAPIVALVGYTNAGKSSLFNTITGENIFAKDQLFATLSPTMRKVSLDKSKQIILSDTVGFISQLPHELIEAFKATLEEVSLADIIIHVQDVSNKNFKQQKKDVISVLTELVSKNTLEQKTINVLNKVDLLDENKQKQYNDILQEGTIAVSAKTGYNTDKLILEINKILTITDLSIKAYIDIQDAKTINWFYDNSRIDNISYNEAETIINARISSANCNRIKKLTNYKYKIEIL